MSFKNTFIEKIKQFQMETFFQGITVTARNIVRHDYLKYLTYTGAVIDARQAKEFGLTTFVTEQDPLEAASKLASQLATQSPKQLESAKQLYRESFIDQEQERHSLTLEVSCRCGCEKLYI